jgi:hypothetical protein
MLARTLKQEASADDVAPELLAQSPINDPGAITLNGSTVSND